VAGFPDGRRSVNGPILPRAKSPVAEVNGAGLLISGAGAAQDNEAPKMKRANVEFARPHRHRDFEFVRAGPEGAYWLAPDGMMVRVAAPEGGRARMREAEWRHTHRAELEIALGRSGAT
jgi:hypothetical protein